MGVRSHGNGWLCSYWRDLMASRWEGLWRWMAFRIRRVEILRAHGTYRTKQAILVRHGATQRAIDTGIPYQATSTRLVPTRA